MAPEYPDEDYPPPPNLPGPTTGGGTPAPGPAGPSDVPIIPSGGSRGGRGGGGDAFPAYPQIQIPGAPGFHPSQFRAPTFADAQNEPGYQSRLAAGQMGLENSQAAQGMVRSGGSLSDLLEYNQNFGANEYQRVYDRQLGAYDRQYRSEYDAFAPILAQWNLRAGGEQQAQLARYSAQLQAAQPRGGGGGDSTDWGGLINGNPWDPPGEGDENPYF